MNFFEKLKLLKKNNATEMNYKMLFQNIIKGIYLSVFLRLCETFSVKVL